MNVDLIAEADAALQEASWLLNEIMLGRSIDSKVYIEKMHKIQDVSRKFHEEMLSALVIDVNAAQA